MNDSPNPHVPDCPYVGLQPYSEAEREYFFGREQDTETIAANLLTAPLTLLYGASGVGKTSVLAAGVVPYLRAMPDVLVVLFRQWQDSTFQDVLMNDVDTTVYYSRAKLLSNRTPLPFDEFLARAAQETNRTLLIILDQFEEYFLYHPNGNPFEEQLARAINRGDVNANFILSMREDALSQLDRFETRIPNLMSNYLRLEHLDRAGAGRAIRKPLDVYNARRTDASPITIEDALVDALIEQVRTGRVTLGRAGQGEIAVMQSADTRDTRIEAPFLQMVLTRLWEEETRAGARNLRLATLNLLGGAEKIVRTHLDEVMNRLRAPEQEVCSTFFDRLVTPSGTKIAQNADDLVTYAARSAAQVTPILKKLADARVLRPIAPPLNQPQVARYEIFHDVIAPAILDWRRRFVDRKRVRRLGLITLGAVLLVVVFSLLSLFAFQQMLNAQDAEGRAIVQRNAAATSEARAVTQEASAYQQRAEAQNQANARATAEAQALVQRDAAEKSKGEALTQQKIAFSRELAGIALARLPVDPEQSLLLALHAAEISPTEQAEDALRQSLRGYALRAALRGHTASVYAGFSPDGKFIVTASLDNTARVWETSTGKSIVELRGHTGQVRSAQFSPDGKFIVTASQDGTARVWEASTGKSIAELRGHTATVRHAVFSPDGKFVVTGSNDYTARIWEASTGKNIRELRWHGSSLSGVAYSPDGKSIVTVSSGAGARIWEASTGRGISELRGHTKSINSVAFSPDGKFIVTASSDNTARVWETSTGRNIAELQGHTDVVRSATFSPDGMFVVTGSSDNTAHVWEASTGKSIMELRGHTGYVTIAAFSPDGKFIVTVSRDGTARVWEASTGRGIAELRGHTTEINSVEFSPDSKFILTGSADFTARLWEANSRDSIIVFLRRNYHDREDSWDTDEHR